MNIQKSGSIKSKVQAMIAIISLAIALFGATMVQASGPAWQPVGTEGFSAGPADTPSLAFDNNGILYIAFEDEGNSNRATVMKFENGSWQNVGTPGFSAHWVKSTSLAIDSNDVPYVAYGDWGNDERATVMKFEGGSWQPVGIVGFSAGKAYHTSLAIDSNDIPYVAYEDDGNSGKATVMKFEGGSWQTVGSPGFSAGFALFTSLALDSNNVPYVAFEDRFNGEKTTVMKFQDGIWQTVGVPGISAGSVHYTSLALDSNNVPYVAYMDAANASKATVMKFESGGWQIVGIAAFSTGSAPYTSLAIDSNDIPYVAYWDGANSGKATVMKFDGSSWQTVGIAGFAAGPAHYTTIAIDSNDIPYVAYKDTANSYRATVMKFSEIIENHDPMFCNSTKFPIPTPLEGVRRLSVGPNGNIWFAEYTANKIGYITTAGAFTEFPLPDDFMGTSGFYNGGPYEIIAGPDGYMWFTAPTANKIGRISMSGDVTGIQLPTPGRGPTFITAGPDGNIWFTEGSANSIGRLTPDGILTEFPIPSPSSEPMAIITGPDGNIWFTEGRTNSSKIGRLTITTGEITEFPVPSSIANDIAVGPDGNLWFTDYANPKVTRMTPLGELVEFPLSFPGIDRANNIVAGPDGYMWFTLLTNDGGSSDQIGRISTVGEFTIIPIPQTLGLFDIIFGPDGNVWTSENYSGATIGRYSLNCSDTTPPLVDVSFPSPDGLNGWFVTSPVDGSITIDDIATGGSNITATTCDGSNVGSISGLNTPSASASLTVSVEGINDVSCTATDSAGNSGAYTGSSNTAIVKLDSLSPVVQISAPANGANYFLNQTAASSYTCSDLTSGVATCDSPLPSSSNIDTTSVGPKNFAVTAIDNAGNLSSTNHSYNVIYNFSGFLQPVDNPPVFNVIKAGRGVSVKFSLAGDQGLSIFASGYPISQRINCDTTAFLDDIEETITVGQSTLSYDPVADRYNYHWKTSTAWAGTCRQFLIQLDDGTYHTANFKFK